MENKKSKEIKRILAMTKKVAKEKGILMVVWLGINMIINRITKQFTYLSYLVQSRIFKRRYIHVIGDSHTGSFKKDKRFFVHHISHATAYNLSKEHSTSNSNKIFWNIIKKIDKKRDDVILIFGEIDCRIHIYYQYKKRGMKESINSLIDKTIESYDIILKELQNLGINFFVYSVPPAAREENIYKVPFYASAEKRAQINKSFNKKLKEHCRTRGYKFIDIYSETCDKNGFARQKYVDDGVHLNKNVVGLVLDSLKLAK